MHLCNAGPDLASYFNADLDQAFHFNADADTASNQSDENLRPLVYKTSRAPFVASTPPLCAPRPPPPTAQFFYFLNFGFNEDADPDPDPAFQSHADPYPASKIMRNHAYPDTQPWFGFRRLFRSV